MKCQDCPVEKKCKDQKAFAYNCCFGEDENCEIHCVHKEDCRSGSKAVIIKEEADEV